MKKGAGGCVCLGRIESDAVLGVRGTSCMLQLDEFPESPVPTSVARNGLFAQIRVINVFSAPKWSDAFYQLRMHVTCRGSFYYWNEIRRRGSSGMINAHFCLSAAAPIMQARWKVRTEGMLLCRRKVCELNLIRLFSSISEILFNA
jgi:hypothetical protein